MVEETYWMREERSREKGGQRAAADDIEQII